MRKAFIEAIRQKNQSKIYYKIKDEVPYKLKNYAKYFFEQVNYGGRYKSKKGNPFIEKYIASPSLTEFIKGIGHQIIIHHGIKYFSSSLLQAHYHGEWGKTGSYKSQRLKKRIGKIKSYEDFDKYYYILESELNELNKQINTLEGKTAQSIEEKNKLSKLIERKQILETILTEKIAHETEDELMVRAKRWLASLT